MTIVVWNGEVLAADKLSIQASHKRSVTKIFRVDGSLLAVTGDWDNAQTLLQWARDGYKVEDYPKFQESNTDFVSMLRIHPDGTCLKYERSPHPMDYTEDVKRIGLFAMGSGRDYAYGAFGAGIKLSEIAVQIASQYCEGCGFGYDWAKLNGEGTV